MMKPALLFATALFAGHAGAASAAQPGADWMSMDQVVRKLAEAGYADIRSLKADDGRWEGNAVKDGNSISVAVDPRTGAVTEKAHMAAQSGQEEGDDDD